MSFFQVFPHCVKSAELMCIKVPFQNGSQEKHPVPEVYTLRDFQLPTQSRDVFFMLSLI